MSHCNPPLDFSARYRVADWPAVAVWLKRHPVVQPECEGHPAGPYDPMGETFYCDGSCESPVEDTDWVVVVMVGDDREHVVEVDELTKIDEDDYCSGYGQIGCGHSTPGGAHERVASFPYTAADQSAHKYGRPRYRGWELSALPRP